MTTRLYSVILVVAFMASAIGVPLIVGPRAKTTSSSSHLDAIQSSINNGQNEIDAPIVDFNSPPDADPAQRAKRLLKSKRHNLRDNNLTSDERSQFVLREQKPPRDPQRGTRPESTRPMPSAKINHDYNPPLIGAAAGEESPAELALPTYDSDAVVLGYVTEASAYLSEDKTSVYSEFGFQISQVLKNCAKPVFDANRPLTVLRSGGGVRFPSGTVKYFLVSGRGLPRVNRRYVLFLKYDDLAKSFYIVTGYELREEKVFPLDSPPSGVTTGHPFASYRKYDGVAESKFLADVQNAILHPEQPPKTGFPISELNPGPEGRK